MRSIVVVFMVLFIVYSVSAYDVLQYSDTFIDQSRDNREIPTEIFYPYADSNDQLFPVIVFGHGWMVPYNNYLSLAEALTAFGFIVVFPLTESDLFPDHNEFGLDILFIGQSIQLEGNQPGSPIYDIVDETFIAMGHSMGGGSCILASGTNEFFNGLITFAAAETSPSAIQIAEYVTCPSLTFSADNDLIAPLEDHQLPMYNNLGSQRKYFINILGETHMGLTLNVMIPSIIISFMMFLSTDDLNYIAEFETVIDSLANENVLEYELENSTLVRYKEKSPRMSEPTCFPNPVNSVAVIQYNLPYQSRVRVEVYDLQGRKVCTLYDGIQLEGNHNIEWHPYNLSSGVYFYMIHSDYYIQTNKITLLK